LKDIPSFGKSDKESILPYPFRLFLGLFIPILIVGGPLAMSAYRKANTRNFRIVEEGVLYRSGQLSPKGLERILDEHRIKTVITLRDSEENEAIIQQGGEPNAPPELAPDYQEELFCRNRGIHYVRISPRNWSSPDNGQPPVQQNLNELLRVLDNPKNHPVLIHCFRGVHRTGAYCAIFRMEYHRWSNEDAIQEMKTLGYTNADFEEDVFGFLTNYQPRWKKTSPTTER
jgi:tyrosine-protein phosphatase SIW14